MERLVRHFRRAHQVVIGERTAARLAQTVRAMVGVDPAIHLGVTGCDASAMLPRRVDVTLGELQAVLEGRRDVA